MSAGVDAGTVERCKFVTAANLMDPKAPCPECRGEVMPYTDPTPKHPEGREAPLSFVESDLDDRHRYRCPRCAEPTMLFSNYMNID